MEPSLPPDWELSVQAFVMWVLLFYIQYERRADNNSLIATRTLARLARWGDKLMVIPESRVSSDIGIRPAGKWPGHSTRSIFLASLPTRRQRWR
jgi:hypothetical protein